MCASTWPQLYGQCALILISASDCLLLTTASTLRNGPSALGKCLTFPNFIIQKFASSSTWQYALKTLRFDSDISKRLCVTNHSQYTAKWAKCTGKVPDVSEFYHSKIRYFVLLIYLCDKANSYLDIVGCYLGFQARYSHIFFPSSSKGLCSNASASFPNWKRTIHCGVSCYTVCIVRHTNPSSATCRWHLQQWQNPMPSQFPGRH